MRYKEDLFYDEDGEIQALLVIQLRSDTLLNPFYPGAQKLEV